MKRRDFLKISIILPIYGCAKTEKEKIPSYLLCAEAIAEALFPQGRPFNVDVKKTDFIKRMEKTLKIMPSNEASLMKVGLTIIEYMPRYFSFHFKRLSELSIEDRRKYLLGWEESAISLKRIAFKGIKQIICLVYGSLPEVKKEIAFAYPCGSYGRTIWEE
jgi:hypothetical protein